MHQYFIKIPEIVKKVFYRYIWSLPATGNEVYLTFDDGPHPAITPWVLDELDKYGAKATFFCIGNNVRLYPDVYAKILQKGHAVGNHTYNHLNGWKTETDVYIDNIIEAAAVIKSNLFRPPYGRIRRQQAIAISKKVRMNMHVVMWDVLSADFDKSYAPAQCIDNVIKNVKPGSIIVFHDSEKAYPNLKVALPEVLKDLTARGFVCKRIELE